MTLAKTLLLWNAEELVQRDIKTRNLQGVERILFRFQEQDSSMSEIKLLIDKNGYDQG